MDFCVFHLRVIARQGGARLVQGRLRRPLVNREQQVPLLDLLAFLKKNAPLMVPPICERIVTVEYGITWPTGAGSICTGRLVVNASAVTTGAGPPLGATLREHPLASHNAAKIAGIKNDFFMSVVSVILCGV